MGKNKKFLASKSEQIPSPRRVKIIVLNYQQAVSIDMHGAFEATHTRIDINTPVPMVSGIDGGYPDRVDASRHETVSPLIVVIHSHSKI